MQANHHCFCTEPSNENSKYYFHGIDIVQNDGDFLRSFEIQGCEASSGQNKFTVACHDHDFCEQACCPEDASSPVTILLIIAGLVCLILLAVVFQMHRRIKELEEKDSNQDQENKEDAEKQACC